MYVFKSNRSYCFEDLLFLKIYLMANAIQTMITIAMITTKTAIMVVVALQFNEKKI